MPDLTYNDFYRTGVQDCGNVMELDEFDLDGGTAEQVVENTWAGWETDGMEEQWLAQQDDLEGLDPHECYENWKRGWKLCATREIAHELERARENPSDLDSAMEHALKLVEVLSAHGLRAKTWGKPGVGVRVYVDAAKGYLVVSRGGDVSDRSRGAATLLESNLYPAQRAAYKLARDEYRRLQATGNPSEHPFYVDIGDGDLVPEYASFEEALDDALTRVVRAGTPSVRVVHGSEVAGFDDVADVLLFDEYDGRQAIGEMHDLPEAVIVLHEAGLDLTTLANDAPYTATFKYGPWRSGQRDDSVVAVILARDEQRANPSRKRTDLTSAEIAKIESVVVEQGLGTLDLTPARKGKFVAKVAPLADAATIIESLRLIGLDAEELKGEESGRLLVKLPKREPRAARPSALPRPPAKWWNRPVPKDQLCYASRSDALKRFLDENYELIQNYGGVDYQVGASEFDAINHKYGLTGERAARTIADAVWYAMPAGKPYCVERIDLDALNGISAVLHGGIEFRLPDYVYDQNLAADEAKQYAQWREDALEEHDARLAEAEEAEAQRAFAEAQAPIPSLPAPISLPVPDGEAFIDAYIVPSHVVGTAYEPWMEDQLMVTRERRALMRPAAASNPGCGRGSLNDNPSRGWVTKVIARHYDDMQQEVPAKWLPKIASIKGTGGRKVAAQMKEYGCGAYGCVLPTYDPDVVLKLTTDDTEAEFAHNLASSISAPIVVKYRKTVTLPEEYHGHGTYLLWRQSADEVGNLLDVIKARKGNRSKAFAAIAKQHKAAQRAYDALLAGKPAHDKLDAWRAAAKLLGEEVPELRELMRGMIKVLDEDGVFFGDIHDGNLGLVNGKWLIVDPGHVAVITEDA